MRVAPAPPSFAELAAKAQRRLTTDEPVGRIELERSISERAEAIESGIGARVESGLRRLDEVARRADGAGAAAAESAQAAAEEAAELQRELQQGVGANREELERVTAAAADAISAIDAAAERAEAGLGEQVEGAAKAVAKAALREELATELEVAEGIRDETRQLVAQAEESLAEGRSEVAAIEGRIGERLAPVFRRFEEGAGATTQASEHIVAAMERIEQVYKRLEESERRVLGIEARMSQSEVRVNEAAESAERAARWEARMQSATETELDAAQRLEDAEERILRLVSVDEPEGRSA